jgi:flagellar export protein FliJ
MKKFEFHLESALRLRNTQLQAEQLKLQRLIAEEQQLGNSLLALTTEQNAARTAFHPSASVAAADLRALSSFLVGMELASARLAEQIAAKQRVVEEQRSHVIAAERNVKLLEKLKAQRFAEWNHELDLQLETLAQEVWTSAHIRR